ncbi:MAG: 5-(carboxyamino)imidazole ribonucleotide synthase [Haliscomenobacteraceae bacterium CHB4]|nr:5-(carboxyamino)imidazole ribonucleotide synthase [Haliscomenobacteraceae bacterium CHB4]
MFSTTQKIGILGGGQLGKMLCLAAADWDLKTYVLDASPDYPAGQVCTGFTAGDFNKYDDVLAFGLDKDILTIEIEHVNTEALRELERLGKTVHPAPRALDIIKDKGLQKEFYLQHDIPTARHELFGNEKQLKKAIESGKWSLPLVQKLCTAGYDGRGVAILRTAEDLERKLMPGVCIAEELAPIRTELAVVAARNAAGDVSVFPPVEMDFHPEANLVEFLLCPARVSPLVAAEAEALAEKVIRTFDICGLLAVEMFLTTDGQLLVNEVAPRPHNSGHHTIDSAPTSQFQQHLRAICNFPLGPTVQQMPAVMINLLGEPGHKGPVQYEGVEACLALEGVYIHLYGKALTSPFRKMGHATVTAATAEEAIQKAQFVKNTLKVKATNN